MHFFEKIITNKKTVDIDFFTNFAHHKNGKNVTQRQYFYRQSFKIFI